MLLMSLHWCAWVQVLLVVAVGVMVALLVALVL
jgi:hypothetical protein